MLVIAWILGLALAGAALLGMLWLRQRRIRLQVEARYLSAVAEFDTPAPDAATLFAEIHGEPVRRLLRGLIGPGLPLGPASWTSSGWLRYDSDSRERAVTAITYCVPGVWWAQIRRVRLRGLGWIDEIHEVEGSRVSSGYWWLGLYRVDRPGLGPEPLALQAQASEKPCSFPGRGSPTVDRLGNQRWGRRRGPRGRTGHGFGCRSIRPAGLLRSSSGAKIGSRIEFGGWYWSDRALGPESLRLIEGVGTVNEFTPLQLRLAKSSGRRSGIDRILNRQLPPMRLSWECHISVISL
jgi:hypothetical protein